MATNLRTVLTRGLAMAGALPLVLFATLSLAGEVPRLLADDPCFVWGHSGGAMTVGIPPCEHGAGGTSETKTQAVMRLSVIQGGILAAAALALAGTFTRRPRLCIVGFVMLFVISLPLMVSGLGILTLLCACCFLPACYQPRPRET